MPIINDDNYLIDNRDARTTEIHFTVDGRKCILRVDPVYLFLNMLENLPEPAALSTGSSPHEAIEVVVDRLCRIEVLDRNDPEVAAILYDPDGDDAEEPHDPVSPTTVGFWP